jgi:hypothetical protein
MPHSVRIQLTKLLLFGPIAPYVMSALFQFLMDRRMHSTTLQSTVLVSLVQVLRDVACNPLGVLLSPAKF